ncbi:MAG TPA: hypothetical protein VFX22_05520 [Candidatus Kapabacteria bacterium]|nr:hypothetical protein [Candidatus Kapabacteria bacterium]
MKITIPIFFSIGIALLLASCSPSKYMAKSDNWQNMYGYSEAPIDSSTWQVTYAGDNTMPPDLVDRYALYRSAELTVAKNYDYFIVMNGQANANSMTTTVGGGSIPNTTIEHQIDPQTGKMIPVAVTTTSPNYMTSTFTAHTVTKTIRMFKGARPAENANAYDAKSMLSVMGPSIQR